MVDYCSFSARRAAPLHRVCLYTAGSGACPSQEAPKNQHLLHVGSVFRSSSLKFRVALLWFTGLGSQVGQEHWSLAVALPVRSGFILCSLSSATSRGWRMIVQAFFPTPCAATAWLPKPKPTICSSLSQATATAQAPGL